MMNDWLRRLNNVASDAAEAASLPYPSLFAFDGDSWVWVWSSTLQPSNELGETITEVHLRVRPDSLADGFQTEVSALAWVSEHRDLSWARTFTSSFLLFKDLEYSSSVLPSFRAELRDTLDRAFKEASNAAYPLGEIQERREQTAQELQKRGLPPQ